MKGFPDHPIFSIAKYGINKERFWPLGAVKAKRVFDSMTFFKGSNVPEYFANCGFDISGIINFFYNQDIDPTDVIFYLEDDEPDYQRQEMWNSPDMADYLAKKDLYIPYFDWKCLEDLRECAKEEFKIFEQWTLAEVFISAAFRLYIDSMDVLVSGLIDSFPSMVNNTDYSKVTELLALGKFAEAAEAKSELSVCPATPLQLKEKKEEHKANFCRKFCVPFFENFIFNTNFLKNNLDPTFLDEELNSLFTSLDLKEKHKNIDFMKAFKKQAAYLWEGDFRLSENSDLEERELHSKYIEFRKNRLVFCSSSIVPLLFSEAEKAQLQHDDPRSPKFSSYKAFIAFYSKISKINK